MSDQLYISLEHKIDKLIKLCSQLHKENTVLTNQQTAWNVERSELVRKNEKAVQQLKEMVTRLQDLEKHS